MAKQELRVLEALQRYPMHGQQELAEYLGMSRIAVAGHITRLMKKGLVLGKGYVFPKPDQWLVIGGANLDCQGISSGEVNVADSYPGNITESPGGVARNIAENLSRLDLKVRLISAVGRDRSGDWLIEHCQNAGIITDNIFQIGHLNTSRYLSILNEQGQLQLAIADMSIVEEINASLLETIKNQFSQTKGIVVDCNLSAAALEFLFNQTGPLNFYVDAVSQAKAVKLLPWLHKIHTLKLNLSEAIILQGEGLLPESMAKKLVDSGVKQVLLSLGKDGVVFANQSITKRFDAESIEVVSDVGAGDALFSGFIAAEAMELQIDQKVRFAQACAEITLKSSSANHSGLSILKVEKWLNQQ